MITIANLPNVKLTGTGSFRQSQPLTLANVRKVLEHLDMVVRFDMLVADTALFLGGKRIPAEDAGYALETIADVLVKLDINNISRLDSVLKEIAWLDKFHPMEDWLKGLAWDGADHVERLMDSVKTDNGLWPVYLENWLVQVVEGVCGWRDRDAKKSLPHVLVLVGGQGIGKSHWLKGLGGRWFKGEAELHLSSPSGKDHQIEALKFPMVELAELDGIFRKSDISHMKAFISREEDSIRSPYARRAVVRPRMTTFCASVNDPEFLTDTTGSRRFWPVQVESIDWSVRVDPGQLWAQAYAMWKEDSDFNLTASQDAERAATALEVHTLVSEQEETLRDYYRRHRGNKRFPAVAMNRSEILKMLFGARGFSSVEISGAGKIITDMLGKHRTLDGKQRAWMFPYNEFATDRATWPDKISLESV
jgi:predicted P-loop ATPase